MLAFDIFLFILLPLFILSIIINIPNGFYLIYISIKGKNAIKQELIRNPNKMKINYNFPSISILLPVLNEESQITELLENMLCLEYQGTIEILLLDDGSIDQTLFIANLFNKKFQMKNNSNFKIITKSASEFGPSKGKFENLNRGLMESTGEIICILDADARLETQAISKVVEEFSSNDTIVGVQIPWKHRNSNDSWLTKTFVTGIEIHQQIMQRGRSMIGAMIPTYGSGEFWLASSIKSVKGWNNVITEDIELSYRIQLEGKKVNLTFNTYSDQLAPNSLPSFIQQQSRWAAGFFQTFKKLSPNILRGKISNKAKLDSILLMLFYGLPAITYINFLCFCFIAILYNFQPLLDLSLLLGLIISFLIIGLIGSVFLQAFIFWRYLKKSFTKSLLWSSWLSITGLALAPFFFKAMIDGFTRKKLEFKVTPKELKYKIGYRKFLPKSFKITSIFLLHIIFIGLILIHAFTIFGISSPSFLSIASYLGSLISINILFTILSF